MRKNNWLCFFPLVKGDERQTNCLLLMISHAWNQHCCAMPIIITSMPKFAAYRIMVEWIVLFVKIVNQYFEREECFWVAPVAKFWWQFCENQGHEEFVLVSCSFKAYYKLHRLAFTWLDAMMDIRAVFRPDHALQKSHVAIRGGPPKNGKEANLTLYFYKAAGLTQA